MQNWNPWQLPAGPVATPMPQPPIGYAATGTDPMATMQNYMQYFNQPAPTGYTTEQWATAQQQNWAQWQTWQQQYQQWQAQYGEKYEQTMKQMSTQNIPNATPAASSIVPPPPLPKEDSSTKPPLPPDSGNIFSFAGVPPPHQNNLPLFSSRGTANPPLPPGQPPLPPDNSRNSSTDMNLSGKRGASSNVESGSAKKLKIEDEELTVAEKKFDARFKIWEEQFNKWKQQNANHPDKTQYKQYESEWTSWREKLIERREQMRRKREQQKPATVKTDVDKEKSVVGGDKILNLLSSTENQGLINNLLGIGKTLGLTGKNEVPTVPQVPPMPVMQPPNAIPNPAMAAPTMTPNMNQAAWAAQQWAAQYNAGMSMSNYAANYQQTPPIAQNPTNVQPAPMQMPNFGQPPTNFQQPPPSMQGAGSNFPTAPPNMPTVGPNFSLPPPGFGALNSRPQQSQHDSGQGQRLGDQLSSQDANTRSFKNDGDQRQAPLSGRDSMGAVNDRFGFEGNRFTGPPPNDLGGMNRGGQFGSNDNFGRDKPNKDFGPGNQFGSLSDNNTRVDTKRDFSPSGRTSNDFRSGDRFGSENDRFGSGFDRDQGANRFGRDGDQQDNRGDNRSGSDGFNTERFGSSNDRFGSNNDRFGLNNDRFTSSNERFGANNDSFNTSNDRFGSNNDRLGSGGNRSSSGNDQTKFDADRFGPSNDRFRSGNDQFGTSNDRFGPPNLNLSNDKFSRPPPDRDSGNFNSRDFEKSGNQFDAPVDMPPELQKLMEKRKAAMDVFKPSTFGSFLTSDKDSSSSPSLSESFRKITGDSPFLSRTSSDFNKNKDTSLALRGPILGPSGPSVPRNFDPPRDSRPGDNLNFPLRPPGDLRQQGPNDFGPRGVGDFASRGKEFSPRDLSDFAPRGKEFGSGDSADFGARGNEFAPRDPSEFASRGKEFGPGDSGGFPSRGNEFGSRDSGGFAPRGNEFGDSGNFGSRGIEFGPRDSDEFASRAKRFDSGDSGNFAPRGNEFGPRDSSEFASRSKEFGPGDPKNFGSRGNEFAPRDSNEFASRGKEFSSADSGNFGSQRNEFAMPGTDASGGGPRRSGDFGARIGSEFAPRISNEFESPSRSDQQQQRDNLETSKKRTPTPDNSDRIPRPIREGPPIRPINEDKNSDQTFKKHSLDPQNSTDGAAQENIPPLQMPPWMSSNFADDDIIEIPVDSTAGSKNSPKDKAGSLVGSNQPQNDAAELQGSTKGSEKKSDDLPFMGENDPKAEDLNMEPPPKLPDLGPITDDSEPFPEAKESNTSGSYGRTSDTLDGPASFNLPFGPPNIKTPFKSKDVSGPPSDNVKSSESSGPRGPPSNPFKPQGSSIAPFGPRGSSDFGPRASSDFGPRPSSDFGPRASSDFGPRASSDFGPRASSDFGPRASSDFGPRGPGDFGPRGPGDFGPRGPGDFRSRGPGDFPSCGPTNFGPRGPGIFAPRGFGNFGPRGPGDFVPQGPGDFAPCGPGNFGPRGPPTGFGPRGPGNFAPRGEFPLLHGPHEDFGPRGPPDFSKDFNDRSFGPNDMNSFGPRGPLDRPFGGSVDPPNDSSLTGKAPFASNPFAPRGNNPDNSSGPSIPSLMSFKFDRPISATDEKPSQSSEESEGNRRDDLPPAFRAGDQDQRPFRPDGSRNSRDIDQGPGPNLLGPHGSGDSDWRQPVNRNKFGDLDQRSTNYPDKSPAPNQMPMDRNESMTGPSDRDERTPSNIEEKMQGLDEQNTKGKSNIPGPCLDEVNPGVLNENDHNRGSNFMTKRTDVPRNNDGQKEFCIEKQFNYNHSAGAPDEISADHLPANVIDYGHAPRVIVHDYVTPAHCYDYSHGKLRPVVPDHDIYPGQDFKNWVENEQNLRDYTDRMRIYDADMRALKLRFSDRKNEQLPQLRDRNRSLDDRRIHDRDRRVSSYRNERSRRENDDHREREKQRESRERGRIDRDREWERASNKHREDRTQHRRSRSKDRTREKPEKIRKEANKENKKDDERSKGSVSGQENSAKKPTESATPENSEKQESKDDEPQESSPDIIEIIEVPKVVEAPVVVDIAKTPNFTMIDDLLCEPGRQNRPPKIVVILRGPPGSGKSFVAKLIKDKEVEQGGSAPRILSLDDYFLTEKEVETEDDNGKKITTKEMVYEYEEAMESSYLTSLNKAFKKNITDGFFNFIILDSINEKISDYEEMWSFAKTKRFRVYVCEMEMDVQICLKRNIHKRTEEEINRIVDYFEPTPSYHQKLDVTSMLQEESIEEVHMEDTEEVQKEPAPANDDSQDSQEDPQDSADVSKWERMEAEDKLDRLDGLAKRKHEGKPQTMEDFLQVPDYYNMEDTSGKRRVRWADLEERKEQEKMRAVGFVVGQTNWDRMMDPTKGGSALTRTKFFPLSQ